MLEIEYRFLNIDKQDIREKLKFRGGELVHPEFKMERVYFHRRMNSVIPDGMLRVRKEFDKVTLTFKSERNQDGFNEEIETEVADYEKTIQILQKAGLVISSRQESLREKWVFDDSEVTIDTRPFLEPYLEIEAHTKEKLIEITKDIGLDQEIISTDSLITLYCKKYNLTEIEVQKIIENITFDKNPFVIS